MTKTTRHTVWPRSAAILTIVAGAAFAGNYDPTNQAGQYQTLRPAELLKGSGGTFADSTVYAPFLEPGSGAIFNASVVEVVNGQAYSAITTFGGTLAMPLTRQVAMLFPTDSGSPLTSGTSVNQLLVELSTNVSSNSLGTLLPDGRLVVYERFGTGTGHGQNNLGFWNFAHLAGSGSAIRQAPNKVIVSTAPNVGNAGETGINPNSATVVGSVFIGTPSSANDPNVMNPVNDNDLITGNTHFNGAPALTPVQFAGTFNGVAVYRGRDNEARSGTAGDSNGTPGPGHIAGWTQLNVPLPTNPGGESPLDARQTQPVVTAVNTPSGATLMYVVHGIGFSGGTPFSGGSARPLYLAVDAVADSAGAPRLDYVGGDPNLSNNTILIEADAAGGVGAQHGAPYAGVAPLAGFADHFNSSTNQAFVDKQATGGGTGPSTNSQFDMNARGQVVALWEDTSVSPRRFEIRLYDPIWDGAGARIEGYTLAKVVAGNGEQDDMLNTIIVDEARTTVESSPGNFVETTITPVSGPAIDDEGRVAFTAITEIVKTVSGDWDGNPFTPNTTYLVASKTALFIWEPTTDTLHRLLEGGEGGADVLADAFIGSGHPGERTLTLGSFPTDQASDGFNRESLSRTGGWLAVNFRASGTQYTGGVPTNFGTFPDGTPIPTGGANGFIYRGGLLYDTVPSNQFGMNETTVRGVVMLELGDFTSGTVCCPGDANGDGVVDFNDITAVLANWNTSPGTPNLNGDANCDGDVNFNDITSILANWLTNCP